MKKRNEVKPWRPPAEHALVRVFSPWELADYLTKLHCFLANILQPPTKLLPDPNQKFFSAADDIPFKVLTMKSFPAASAEVAQVYSDVSTTGIDHIVVEVGISKSKVDNTFVYCVKSEATAYNLAGNVASTQPGVSLITECEFRWMLDPKNEFLRNSIDLYNSTDWEKVLNLLRRQTIVKWTEKGLLRKPEEAEKTDDNLEDAFTQGWVEWSKC